jgi:hypothetical protein
MTENSLSKSKKYRYFVIHIIDYLPILGLRTKNEIRKRHLLVLQLFTVDYNRMSNVIGNPVDRLIAEQGNARRHQYDRYQSAEKI